MKRACEIVVFGVLAFLVTIAAHNTAAAHGYPGLRVNLTESVPVGLYFYRPGPVHRNDLVQVCLPPDLAAYALKNELDLAVAGPCASGVAPLVKVLAAISGDVVEVGLAGITINGRAWPMSAPRSSTAHGLRVGTRFIVAPHYALVLGLHPASWDGRYFGALPSSAIAGRWIPIFLKKAATT